MKEVKRAAVSTLCFVVAVCIITFAIINPYYGHNMWGERGGQDAPIRKQLAGNIDLLVVGASQSVRGVIPKVLDDKLNVCSYNIAGSAQSLYGRYYLMKKEIARNPINTVVIEVAYDIMEQLPESDIRFEGNLRTLGRLDSWSERSEYFLNAIPLKRYGQTYYKALDYGVRSIALMAKNKFPTYDIYNSSKGYFAGEVVDLSLKSLDDKEYLSKEMDVNFTAENTSMLSDMIRYCKEQGLEVIVITTPYSELINLKYNNLDTFQEQMETICEENDCLYYNFNLLKNKEEYFPESTSYLNESHLSEVGAQTFTELLVDVLNNKMTEDRFYTSYNERVSDLNK